MTWGYDAWKLQSPEDAGFYRFDEREDEEDDVERADQCVVESRAYLQRASSVCHAARAVMTYRCPSPSTALEDIKQARLALDEAELRINELAKICEATTGDDLPW